MSSSDPVLWLNGPFDVGKTHTAHALHAGLPGSFVFDPEELGLTLRRLTPPGTRESDFQNHPLWVPFVLEALVEAARRTPAPVTVPDPGRHRAVMSGLRDLGLTVHPFTLLAPPGVIHARLRRRFEGRGSWAGTQVEARLRDLAGPGFATHLNTQGRTVDEVAREVAARVGWTLLPSPESRLCRWWRVTLAHRR